MFSKLMIFYFIILVPNALAQREKAGADPVVDIISDKYEAGQFLMYDCVDKHWVCVQESYYMECLIQRGHDIKERKFNLGCAPIGYFETKKSCFQRQLYMVSQNFGTRFCLHPDWGARELEFTGR